MKKLFIVAVMAIAAIGANAQSKVKAGTWSIQPKAGATITSITGLDDMNTFSSYIGTKKESQINVGATIGGEVEYQVDDRFSVAAGVGYIMQGKQWDDFNVGPVEVQDFKLELGYVNVPIVANFYLFKGFAVKAGAQFGFLTNAKMKATEKNGDHEIKESQDVKDQLSTFDFSIPVGVSYEFDNHIVIDARYNLGLTKINENGSNSSKNSVIMVTLGYKFAL